MKRERNSEKKESSRENQEGQDMNSLLESFSLNVSRDETRNREEKSLFYSSTKEREKEGEEGK